MEDHIVVETNQGKLRGRIRTSSFSNKRYYSFQGIPYGKPPTGDLRFKAPQPFETWEGIRDALEDAPVCVQPAMFVQIDKGDLSQPVTTSDGEEDCLYLNVYTNKHPGRAECKRPVMVSIHGGGFMGGSSNFSSNGPEYLVEEDVVLVFINYRCGPLGFLSLDTEEVPGNAGLKDQTLALKWVRDNIESFGGDPNNVTIFGISAGGASVHYHLLSPLSKGLFHKAIIQSGYGQNLWAFQQSPKRVALNLANKLGCTSEDPGEVLKFLQSVPKDDMMGACLQIVREKDYMMCCSFVFSPSLELVGTEKFLPDTPSNILRRGESNKVPCILGISQNEGTLQQVYLMWSQEKEEEFISYINEKPEILVPHFLGLQPTSNEGKEVQKAIWDFYFKGKPLTLDNFHEYVDLHSDLQFNIGFGETRRFLLKSSTCPTYSYLFTNHSRCLCQTLALPGTDLFKRDKETCHGADCFFYYSSMCGLPSPQLTDQSRQEVLKHIKIWAKFASSGDPTVEELGVKWDQDSKTNPCYMDIGNVWTMREGVPFVERMDFWHHLMDKFCNMKDSVVIATKLGKLRGRIRQNTFSNKTFYSFQGIPFGNPPVGKLRFKAPEPFEGWQGIRDALEDGAGGKSPSLIHNTPDGELLPNTSVSEGDEDCLYLNVYINKLPEEVSTKKPVMVSIHGGGFMGGSGNLSVCGPEYLLEGDTVLVFFNYRCNAFGFLSLDTEEVPGNAGLKDQTLALKWVRDNIESFGGDPNNVTIFGISAGGASVHYQLLSPLSKGLFHKAIIQSGFAQNLWAFQPSPRKLALKLAKTLGCTSEDSDVVLQFLQSVSSEDIIVAHNKIVKEKEYIMCSSFAFSPSVEVAGQEKFLPDTPNNLMKRGDFNKVPTIIGICQNEGVLQNMFLMMSGLKVEDMYAIINNNPEFLVPHFLGLKPGSREEKEAQQAIWDFYLKGEPLSSDNFRAYIDLHSDLQFNLGFDETRRYLLTKSACPTYSYLFTDHSKCPCQVFKAIFPDNVKPANICRDDETCHGADVFFYYTAPSNLQTPELTSESRKAILKCVMTREKFSSSGDPNNDKFAVEWEKDTESRPFYMDIGPTWTMREGVLFADRMSFWQQLSEKYCKH